jgi:hypothetical protein
MEPRDPRTQEALDLAQAITKLWAGHSPGVQGAALAQALAIWLAAHPEIARNGLLGDHIASVRRMVPIILEMQQKARTDRQGPSGHG